MARPDTTTTVRRELAIWAEIVLFPIATLWLATWLGHLLPSAASAYPWLWLVPLLLGLRYGLAASVISSLTLAITMFESSHLGWSMNPPSLIQMVGGGFAAICAGQFRSGWNRRLQADGTRMAYAEQRLESLIRAFFITRLSHDRLEEALITQPTTLRGAMEQVRALGGGSGTGIGRENACALLQLLAQYCRFETIALHLREHGRLLDIPVAALGPMVPLIHDDLLLTNALENEQAAYHSVDQIDARGGAYRVVFPIIDATGESLGVLLVRDLPLLALTEENLTVAAAILQYFADESWAAAETADLRRRLPHCPTEFAHELIKLQRLYGMAAVRSMLGMPGKNSLRSTLMVLRTVKGEADGPAILDAIYAVRRGLDLYWRDPFGPYEPGLLVLLPMAGTATTRGFRDRVERIVQEQHPGAMSAKGILGISEIPVDHRPPATLLHACGIEWTQ